MARKWEWRVFKKSVVFIQVLESFYYKQRIVIYNNALVDDSANRVRGKSERDRETSDISCGRKILHFKRLNSKDMDNDSYAYDNNIRKYR